MDFAVRGYLVDRATYFFARDSADALGLDPIIPIADSAEIRLLGEERFLSPSSFQDFEIFVGSDDQGPIGFLEFRDLTVSAEEEDAGYTVAVIFPEATNASRILIIPIDPGTGQPIDAALPPATNYLLGDPVDPLTIGPLANEAPQGVVDTASVQQDGSITLDVLDGATDADGDSVTLASVGRASNGTTEIMDGRVVYTPNAGFTGDDSFDYAISDGFETTDVTVRVTVGAAANQPPTVSPIDVGFADGETFRQVNLLDPSFVFDPDGDDLSVANVTVTTADGRALSATTDPETGLFSLGDGQFEDLASGTRFAVTIDYDVTDGLASVPNTATVTISGAVDASLAGVLRLAGGAPLGGLPLELEVGDALFTAITDAEGRFEIGHPGGAASLRTGAPADRSTDGIDVGDALNILRMAIGLEPNFGAADSFDFIAADVNRDDRVTVADALETLRGAIGLPTDSVGAHVLVDPVARTSLANDALALDLVSEEQLELEAVAVRLGDLGIYEI